MFCISIIRFIYSFINYPGIISPLLGRCQESQKNSDIIEDNSLKMRILFHLAQKLNEEERLLELHGALNNVIEDQLSLASMHYMRSHYQDAIDIYKRILLENRFICMILLI